jgi:hypothetical protein
LYRSRPSRCKGVLRVWIAAGHANCAMAYFMDGEDATASGMDGAMRTGILKEAKMVRPSRRQKRPNETLGILGAAKAFPAAFAIGLDPEPRAACCGGGACCAPKILANRESLYTHIDMFTADVRTNLAGPAVTSAKDLPFMVDDVVSIKFAVR